MIVTASSSACGEIKICIWIRKCLEENPPKPKPHGIREPPLILEMMVQVAVVAAALVFIYQNLHISVSLLNTETEICLT